VCIKVFGHWLFANRRFDGAQKRGTLLLQLLPPMTAHRLSSWSKVMDKLTTKQFLRSYSKNRPDNIYKIFSNGKYARRQDVKHNQHDTKEHLQHDLGRKGENALVLISEDFFAFGNRALDFSKWTNGLPCLSEEIQKLGRAFRRNFNQSVKKDLEKLEQNLKQKFSPFHNKRFQPRHPGLDSSCETKAEEKSYTCVKTQL
jgi:hypothetical protein